MLNVLFHREKKVNKRDRSDRGKPRDSYIALAIRSGFVEQSDGDYVITERGLKNGCYRTRTGGIGFAGQSLLLLTNSYSNGAN